MLGQGYHIHVAFHHIQLFQLFHLAPRLVEAIEFAPLVKDGGLRGVQILGFVGGVQHAPAKADDAPALIVDGKHDAVAEAVVAVVPPGASFFLARQHAGPD